MSPAQSTPSFWQRRLVLPVLTQLRQGTTPRDIALTLALGAALGIFPILGATTALCAVAGMALRLNQPLIQLANYAAYPLQLLLLIPFYRAGEWLFRSSPVPLLDVPDLIARFGDGPLQFLADYGRVALYGITVWALTVPLLAWACFHILRPLLQRLAARVFA